jgi:hypothetical protein
MRWLKPTIRSVYGLLGNPQPPTDSRLDEGTEDIREAMLSALGPEGPRRFPQITRRIRYANDIHALWYLRGDLMAALADAHGESVARDTMAAISARFRGLLPASLASRPSPLD